jgi:hypothetical protein
MPQAVVDPIQLRQFAQTLKKYNEEMLEKSTALANHVEQLVARSREQEVLRTIRTAHAINGPVH